MFRFNKKKNKPPIRFFNLVPGVSTVYPITKSSELDREWVEVERKQHIENVSKCPVKRFANALQPSSSPSILPEELNSLFSFVQASDRNSQGRNTSIGHCPAINYIMRNGYIIYAPADFSVYTNGKEILETHSDGSFPGEFPGKNVEVKYIQSHEAYYTNWLKDSSKDNTNDTIIKVHTLWNTICHEDILFLQMKVPYVKEDRFTAVTGILDPTMSPEINVQLWWHLNKGENEVVIKAGTPLAMYLPISRKMLEYESSIGTATQEEINYIKESSYLISSNYQENRNVVAKRFKKIHRKYWNS